jgi:riboflavin biosynthesis pyrimidine reductase
VSEPRFESLTPERGEATARELLSTVRPGGLAPGDRPYVLLNMVATVDGRATVGGHSGPIGGPGDQIMFWELRGLCDAVLIGTGTLRAERYGRLLRDPERRARRVATGLEADPLVVLFSRGLDLPWDAPLFGVPEQRVAISCRVDAPEPPATAASVSLIRLAQPTLAETVRVLRGSFGVRSVLCEGGPTLNHHLVAGGLLDELFLTVGPTLAGDSAAPGLLTGPALPRPARLVLRWVLRHGDELFLRYALR